MNTTVEVLQAVYVKIGGSLADTYDGIADGAPVGGYSLITDALKAIYVKCGGSLSTVYSDIAPEAVGEYSQNADIIGAVGKVVELGGNLEPVTVKSSGTKQTVTPQAGVDGFDTITVSPIVLQGAIVNPSTTQQTITPEQGVDGFNSITATPVTAAIDANITAGNIKKDVEILGVTGSYEGGISNYLFIGTPTSGLEENAGLDTVSSLIINDAATQINDYGFAGCGCMVSLSLPPQLTAIGVEAFKNCHKLTSLAIPGSLTNIGDSAFLNCQDLGDVDLTAFDGTFVPTAGGNMFDCEQGVQRFGTLRFLFSSQSALDAFAAASGWSDYSQYFEVAQP